MTKRDYAMRHKQSGLSLVELMISITLGLVLMAGVVQVFLSSRVTFTTQQAVSRVQETGRLGMEFLSYDIRMAGFMGCNSRGWNVTNTLNSSTDPAYRFDQPLEGIDDVEGTTAGYPDALEGTDILVVRSASGNSVGVVKNNNSAQVFVSNTGEQAGACEGNTSSYSGICEGDILVVADCEKARVFQASGLGPTSGEDNVNIRHASSGDPGNALSSWGGSSTNPDENFGTDSEVIKVTTQFYYVANNDRGRPSLWRKEGSRPAEELVEGVQDLQLLYGHSEGETPPTNYENASQLSSDDWANVKSVRVQMLVQSSEDNVVPEPQAYTFNGQVVDEPGDRRLRQVFVSTIGVRSALR